MGDDSNGSETQGGTGTGRSNRSIDNTPIDIGKAYEEREQHWESQELADELERQARETLEAIRETAGELGARVRQVLARASDLWEQTEPGQTASNERDLPPEVDLRARQLARQWTDIDFLVDPELSEGMVVLSVQDAAFWRIELRERGETRLLSEASDPYQGQRLPEPGPVLPVWDYQFPLSPEIEAGERRERLPGTAVIGACLKCNGTGHRPCVACNGQSFVTCPTCHGRARIPCRRCHGRGRIADAAAERRARASKGYFQVQAERLAAEATDRLADFAERLRQDYGVPLPPSAEWAPTAPASGETIPCPECVDGTIPCECGNGKRICETCRGSGFADCPACSGTGRVIRYRELLRRFDTRISERSLPVDDLAAREWLTDEALRRGTGEQIWEGSSESLSEDAPAEVPATAWAAALAFVQGSGRALQAAPRPETPEDDSARRVVSRRLRLLRVPVTHVAYTFAGQPFAFTVVGRRDARRFWAQRFPTRWGRVSRFLKALTRDLQGEELSERSRVDLQEYRGLRSIGGQRASGEQRIRIVREEPDADVETNEGGPSSSADTPGTPHDEQEQE